MDTKEKEPPSPLLVTVESSNSNRPNIRYTAREYHHGMHYHGRKRSSSLPKLNCHPYQSVEVPETTVDKSPENVKVVRSMEEWQQYLKNNLQYSSSSSPCTSNSPRFLPFIHSSPSNSKQNSPNSSPTTKNSSGDSPKLMSNSYGHISKNTSPTSSKGSPSQCVVSKEETKRIIEDIMKKQVEEDEDDMLVFMSQPSLLNSGKYFTANREESCHLSSSAPSSILNPNSQAYKKYKKKMFGHVRGRRYSNVHPMRYERSEEIEEKPNSANKTMSENPPSKHVSSSSSSPPKYSTEANVFAEYFSSDLMVRAVQQDPANQLNLKLPKINENEIHRAKYFDLHYSSYQRNNGSVSARFPPSHNEIRTSHDRIGNHIVKNSTMNSTCHDIDDLHPGERNSGSLTSRNTIQSRNIFSDRM